MLFLTLLALSALTSALTFTTPFPGSIINLSQPYTVVWIPSSSDPSSFALSLVNTNPSSSAQTQILSTDVDTAKGSYTIPANTLQAYGTDFEFVATVAADGGGGVLASSGSFSLAQGVDTLSTGSAGVLTVVPSSTVVGSVAATTRASSAAMTTASVESTTVTSAQTSVAGVRTSSSAPVPSTALLTSASTSTSSTSSSSVAATSSGSSNTSGNLGFDSAAETVRGSVLVSCAAILAALVMLA